MSSRSRASGQPSSTGSGNCSRNGWDSQPLDDEAEREERRQSVAARVVDLLDSWLAVVDHYQSVNSPVNYQKYEPGQAPGRLLREMLDEEFDSPHQRKFRANRSLRDVEPDVNLYIKPLTASLSDS